MSRRAKLPIWADVALIPLINVTLAFLAAGVVVAMIGENPLDAVEVLVRGAFGYDEAVGYTLYYTTNFIFTGLAVAVAFHAGLFNIGGEGQAYIGGLGVGLVCLALDHLMPWWLLLPVAIGAACSLVQPGRLSQVIYKPIAVVMWSLPLLCLTLSPRR